VGTKRHIKTWILVSLCVILLAGPGVIWGRTVYVDQAAAGRQDGSSWAGAFRCLQDALAVAVAGDEIRVARGEYPPDRGGGHTAGDRNATFRVTDGATIKGGFAGMGAAEPDLRDTTRFATILTGDLDGNDDPNEEGTFLDNSAHVVIATEASNGAVLDGLTIAHGYDRDSGGNGLFNQGASVTLCDCTFFNDWTLRGRGSGIYNDAGGLRLENCRFLNNRTDGLGAGIYNNAGSLRLENCRFVRNYGHDGGGALYNWGGSAQVINCEFIENGASEGAGAIKNINGNADFFHCLFQGNHVSEGTGAITSAGTLRLLYCTFVDNRGGEEDGALFLSGSAVVAHCLFCRNRAEQVGAIYVGSTSVRLDQCTFYANVSTDDGVGAVYCRRASSWSTLPAGSFQARGCIFWANGAWREQDEGGDKLMTGYREQIDGDSNAATLAYCCVQGWTPQRGGLRNIGVDPLFVAPDQNDFHLKSQAGRWDSASLAWVLDDVTSPCIDAGDPNAPVEYEPFPNGGRVNLGAYGGTCEASKSWFGVGPSPAPQAADLNGDGRVDAEDYRLATLRWPPVYE
jgi:hypothetical protein